MGLNYEPASEQVTRNTAELAKEARINLEKLGPTYIKAGQMMSVRPDVLPQEALDELAILQDSVKPFDSDVAIASIERELGPPRHPQPSTLNPQPSTLHPRR